MRYLIILLLTLTISNVQSQTVICLGSADTLCAGTPFQIQNCGSGGGSTTNAIVLNAPTVLPTMSDDSWSSVVPIGFTFSFYGVNYMNCVIGSNGLVSFNTGNANGGCAWSLGGVGPMPSTTFTSAHNTIMACYSDMNPSMAPIGTIEYQTIGTAPNRQFVVLYKNVNAFSCPATCYYASVIMYETSNNVEVHLGQKPMCASWNGGLAIQGVQKNGGLIATTTPGRNNSVWTCNQDGRRFTPTSPTNTNAYTHLQIPYITVSDNISNVSWANTLGQTFPYNAGILNVSSPAPGTVGYFLTTNSCNSSVGSVSDTAWVTRDIVSGTSTTTTDYCAGGNGTANIIPTQGFGPFTFSGWPGGQTTQSASGLVTGPYVITITDSKGCSANVNVNVPNASAAFSVTSTLVSCAGGNDGTATATMTPALGTISYNWYNAGGQTTQTATGLSAGVYNCEVSSTTGCIDTVQVTVTEIPALTSAILTQTDPTCNSGSDGIIVLTTSNGTSPYSFSWDNSSSTIFTATDLAVGPHTITVTDALGCVVVVNGTLTEPPSLAITSLTSDLVICPENSTTLSVTGTGGSSAYTFTWTENGNPIGTGTSINVDPSVTNTQYCVTMSEACGSPTTNDCMVITFPTPVSSNFIPNKPYSCIPGDYVFFNNSTEKSQIDTMFVIYGDGTQEVVIGGVDLAHVYANPGIYDINITYISTLGCTTTGSHPAIANVIPNPVADFTMSANPTTFFETVIGMQDFSSGNVDTWVWYSPLSTPTNSTQNNPTFTFPEGVTGTYPISLIVTTLEGCMDTITKNLTVNSDILFFAPNSFTPDGDEFNQSWKWSVQGIDDQDFSLFIFNRWGEILWETHDPNSEWDGTYKGEIIPAGIYTWRARVKNINSDGKKEFTGHINIIR